MRFSAVTVSAAVFGVALALPANVVYTTEIVTITSCAASVTNCPGRTHTSVAVLPSGVISITSGVSISSAPSVPGVISITSGVSISSAQPVPSVVSITSGVSISSAPSASSIPAYPTGVPIPVTGINSTHPHTTSPHVTGTTSSYAWAPSGSPVISSAPGNSSVPVVPSTPGNSSAPGIPPVTPPAFPGAASTNGFSFAVVAIAAAAFIFV